MTLNNFDEIAATLKRQYDEAILLTVDNSGHFNRDIEQDSLVYVVG